MGSGNLSVLQGHDSLEASVFTSKWKETSEKGELEVPWTGYNHACERDSRLEARRSWLRWEDLDAASS
jgi:hypothetical protein